jgi:phosphoribosylamine---glycine ligase
MKVLVVGGGGREHAICWALARSSRVDEVACLPGNAGIAKLGRLIPGNAEDVDFVTQAADEYGADLVVVGPEGPLCLGLADRLRALGIAVVGHSSAGARLEGSKVFAKEFMARNEIPTAAFTVCETADAARAAVRKYGFPVAIKADGLAAGKGVVVAFTGEEAEDAILHMMEERRLGDAGAVLVVEEGLSGQEASMMYFTDGERLVPIPVARDYKRAFDGDEGPNTGGMGTYSVDGLVDDELQRFVRDRVAEPTVRRMREEGSPLSGILYIGLMLTPGGPSVLEYNLRFGDPETQSVLKRLDSDILDVFEGIARGSLEGIEPVWSADAAVCVVVASSGYPGSYEKGKAIEGLDDAAGIPGITVFHAGTSLGPSGEVTTSGGRVLGVTARAATIAEARDRAYAAVDRIAFEGMIYRRDIGR